MCKNKKILILAVIILAGMGMFYTAPVFAGASITLTGDAWDVGSVAASTIVDSSATYTGGAGTWTITNNSGGSEGINVKVSSSGNWTADNTISFGTPANALGINKFGLLMQYAAGMYYISNILTLSETNHSAGSNGGQYMGNSESMTFKLRFISPPVGSEEGAHTLTITVTAVNWHTFACGDNLVVNHTTANGVAPEDKSTVYGTILTSLSGESKCWITRNLGASTQASYVGDASESSAGWYWQFNRKQGYKYDGTTRTPSTEWITSISEDSNWEPGNDPCTVELGSGWRLPTSIELYAAVTNGSWNNYNDTYASVLKIHSAGRLDRFSGDKTTNPYDGGYWSSTESAASYGKCIWLQDSMQIVNNLEKTNGLGVRCIKD